MTLPTTVRVAGVEYTVDTTPAIKHCKSQYMGVQHESTMELWVDGNLPPASQRKVLLHEIMHAVSDAFLPGCRLTEEQTQGMESGLWALFKDNPGLGAQLFGSAT